MAAAVVAANRSNQAAAASDSSDNAMPAAKLLVDPQLLMAARRGDSKRLQELLRLNTEEVELHGNTGSSNGGGGVVVESVESSGAVILEVAPDGPPAAPATPPPPPPPPLVDGVTLEGDTLLHVVAACGDGDDFIDCAKMIVRDKKRKGGADAVRLALQVRNREGDTPLHCAAGAGNANMICCFIGLIVNDTTDNEAGAAVKKAFLRLQNECGETALHQAIRATMNNNVVCIDKLMAVDPELACIPHDGASPLYIAISLGEMEIARHLYAKSEGKLSYSGPHGRNVLHAAVHRGQALPMILEWLKDSEPKEDSSSVSLVSRLTSQRDRQQKGSTPLHLAASLDCWPHAGQVWPTAESVVTLLLDANESTAYQADDQGSYPIHVAAWGDNSLDVVKLLLERCPDCATLRDGKGRTFLHVAAKKKRYAVVEYVVCGETIMPQHLSRMILNAQDSNGDTALHCAVRAGNLAVFNCLLQNRQVRLDVANKHGMTPLDVAWTNIPAGYNYAFNPRNIVRSSLLVAGAPHGGGNRPELFYEKHMPKRDVDKESKKHTEATQVMGIVAVLIATVTFASAFTFPGGYRSDGEPVHAGRYAFDTFILADTLAFVCSITATCTLVYAGFPAVHISIRNWYTNVSVYLLLSAARSLVAAFGLGLYLVVHNRVSAIAACAIVFASSLYAHMEVRRFIPMATAVLARIGIRRRAVVRYTTWILSILLVHFWTYVIIFGLPAVRKRVH